MGGVGGLETHGWRGVKTPGELSLEAPTERCIREDRSALQAYIAVGLTCLQANLPYMLWVAAYNTTFLLSYLVIELLFSPDRPVPSLLEAINENGLAIFLAANLLTGLINLSMKTMYADDFTSMIVLVGYSGAVCSIAWLGRGYRLKL